MSGRTGEQPDRLAEDDPRWLRLALEASGVGIWDWDLITGAMAWSPTARRIYGFAADEPLTLDRIRDVTFPEDLAVSSAISARARDPALRSREPYEFRIRTPDGTTRWIAASGEAVFDGDGPDAKPLRYVGTLQDITARKLDEVAIREAEAKLRLALDAARMALWDFDGTNLTASAELYRILGFADRPIPTVEEITLGYLPGQQEVVRQAAAGALQRGERHFEAEYQYRRPDGEVCWLMVRAEILFDAGGTPNRALGVMLDVTARKEQEEQLTMALREMDHRVKNAMATVQAIVGQSFRSAGSLAEARGTLEERLAALSRVHSALVRQRWQGVALGEIVDMVTAPYRQASGASVVATGEHVLLDSAVSVAMAMILNELCTNAAKYGALSVPGGAVAISWERVGPGERLAFRWAETGGPPVAEPVRRGFGTRLIEGGLPASAAPEVSLDFRPEGLVCEMRLDPLPERLVA